MQNLSYNNYCLVKQKLLMAGQELPSKFDVIVIGTGLEESIVAAACARNGHTVLHIDDKDYYGGEWAAFTFDGLQTWIDTETQADKSEAAKRCDDFANFVSGEERIVVAETPESPFKNIRQEWFVPDKVNALEDQQDRKVVVDQDGDQMSDVVDSEEDKKLQVETAVAREESPQLKNEAKTRVIDKETVLSQSKRFSLDLMPHLLFSRGSMVELLIKSNVSRYTEFKAISRVLTVLNGVLEHVPSSRSDVFSTKHISVIEKRILMKFINFCINYESDPEVYAAYKEKTFFEFLKSQRLTDNLIHFVLYSIAMVKRDTGCLEGLAATQKFLLSLGRFGNTPFLWPMYGSGELPQAFCRLCAVFGGVYYLSRSFNAVIVEAGRVVAVVSEGQRIDCSHLVIGSRLCPKELKGCVTEKLEISRKICLLSESVMPSDSEQISFLSLSPDVTKTGNFAFVQEVGFGGATTPNGLLCLQLTSKDDQDGLTNCYDVIDPEKKKLVWTLNFSVCSEVFTSPKDSGTLENLYVSSGPSFELDFDTAIARASKLFDQIYPGEEFLPRAPDPEEIIIGNDDESTESKPEVSSQDQEAEAKDRHDAEEVRKGEFVDST